MDGRLEMVPSSTKTPVSVDSPFRIRPLSMKMPLSVDADPGADHETFSQPASVWSSTSRLSASSVIAGLLWLDLSHLSPVIAGRCLVIAGRCLVIAGLTGNPHQNL